MKLSIKKMIREEVIKAFRMEEEVVSKTVTLELKTLEAIMQALEVASANGYKKLNGIDTSALIQTVGKISQPVHEPYKLKYRGSHGDTSGSH